MRGISSQTVCGRAVLGCGGVFPCFVRCQLSLVGLADWLDLTRVCCVAWRRSRPYLCFIRACVRTPPHSKLLHRMLPTIDSCNAQGKISVLMLFRYTVQNNPSIFPLRQQSARRIRKPSCMLQDSPGPQDVLGTPPAPRAPKKKMSQ